MTLRNPPPPPPLPPRAAGAAMKFRTNAIVVSVGGSMNTWVVVTNAASAVATNDFGCTDATIAAAPPENGR